jgi:hypothetical protein
MLGELRDFSVGDADQDVDDRVLPSSSMDPSVTSSSTHDGASGKSRKQRGDHKKRRGGEMPPGKEEKRGRRNSPAQGETGSGVRGGSGHGNSQPGSFSCSTLLMLNISFL